MESKKFINQYMEETKEIIENIDKNQIEKFIEILFEAWKNDKKVITMGNGGSASTASHFAGDLAKTVANPSSEKDISQIKGFKAMCLNDNPACLTAWINDTGWEKAYSGLLNTLLQEGDIIIPISVHGGSGWSGNLVQAMQLAKQKNAKILGLSGFDGGKMKEMADACVVVPKDSTPHVEGLHGVLQHLIIWSLKELISEYSKYPILERFPDISKEAEDNPIKLFVNRIIQEHAKKDMESKEINQGPLSIQEEFKKQTSMIFFADTAALEEIEYSFSVGVDDGITTNPKIIESTGDLSIGFENACKNILQKYPDVPVSLETDLRGINPNEIHKVPEKVRDILLQQANNLISWQNNVVVKIPICEGGILATKILSERGIKTNVTACMTPYQALEAAKAGATYVSLFANRMLDSNILELAGFPLDEITENPKWKEIIKENKNKYFEQAWEKTLNEIAYVAKKLDGTNSKLIVGSIRSPEDILRLVKCKPQVITIPTNIIRELEHIGNLKLTKRSRNPGSVTIGHSLYHPMTQYTLEEFELAADTYRQ